MPEEPIDMVGTVDVCLVRPQEHDYDYLQWHEDLNIGHLLREMTEAGLKSKVHDFALRPLLSPDDYLGAIAAIADSDPKIIFLVIDKHPTNSPHYAGRFLKALREFAPLSKTHLTIYGNTQVGTPRLLQEFPVDSVVVGEEVEARLLAGAVVSGSPLSDVPGISYLDAGGLVIEQPPLQNHVDFAGSRTPYRYFFDVPPQERHNFGYVAAMEASRGCYAKCTFCYIRTKERVYGEYNWVGRRPADIVSEMLTLYHSRGAREFAFLDPQFFAPGKAGQAWARQIAEQIDASGMQSIAFSIYARANDMQRDTLQLLKKAGLYAVFIGIESFSQSVLNRYKKGMTVARNLAAIELLMELDIRLRMGFVSFDHYTTFAELEESLQYLERLLELKPHLITQPVFFQNILAPLDDTPIGDEYRAKGACGMAALQSDDRLFLTKRQERLTRGGPVTMFADPAVALVSEIVRVLASEITQRSTRLERSCSEYLAGEQDDVLLAEGRVTPGAVMAWFDDLTRFAVTEFARVVRTVRAAPDATSELEFGLEREISVRAREFDIRHLGVALTLGVQPDLAIVD